MMKNNLQHKTGGKLKATEKVEAIMSLPKHLKELSVARQNVADICRVKNSSCSLIRTTAKLGLSTPT
jgi:hypothetical protein